MLTRHFFDLTVDALAPHDDTWTTCAGVTGAALWVPYGRAAMPDDEAERFAGTLADLAGPFSGRLLKIMALLDDHRPAVPHEYLWFLGVVPTAQAAASAASSCGRLRGHRRRGGVSRGDERP